MKRGSCNGQGRKLRLHRSCSCHLCQEWVPFLRSKSGQLIEEERGKEAEKVRGSPKGVVISKREGVESCRGKGQEI